MTDPSTKIDWEAKHNQLLLKAEQMMQNSALGRMTRPASGLEEMMKQALGTVQTRKKGLGLGRWFVSTFFPCESPRS